MDIFNQEPIILDLKENTYKEIEIHQLDDSILNFDIVNYGIPVDLTNYTIEFRCAKPTKPKTYTIQNTSITKNSKGRVTIDCDNSITNVSGCVNCELRLISSSFEQLTTFNIDLIIKKSVLEGIDLSDPFTITALETLNNVLNQISNSIEQAISTSNELISANANAKITDGILNTTISTATSKNDTLNTSINNISTAQTNASAFKTDFDNSIGTIKTNATTFKTSFNESISSSISLAQEVLSDIQSVNTSSGETLNSLLNNNRIAKSNIDILQQYQTSLPSYKELMHTNFNIIDLVVFMERNQKIKVSGINNNMYIDSLIDATGVTLNDAIFDEDDCNILFGDGYIQSMGFYYE